VSHSPNPLAALRRFTRPAASIEQCGLCGQALPPTHEHLAEPAGRRLVCACAACAILFGGQEAGRYRRVMPRLERLPDLALEDEQLAALGVPVGLAFFYRSTASSGMVAVYPSPAGPLDSFVEPASWDSLTAHAVLWEFEPDVEALLVNRLDGASVYYRCSIDRCYHLIGLVRTHWRGFSGGPDLWREVASFFAGLRAETDTTSGRG